MMVDLSRIAHLDEVQRNKLLPLLDEFHTCFSDKSGLCSATESTPLNAHSLVFECVIVLIVYFVYHLSVLSQAVIYVI